LGDWAICPARVLLPGGVMQNRREFVQALTIISAASLMQACSGNSVSGSDAPQLATVSGAVNGSIVTVNVDATSPLNTVGNAAIVSTSRGDLLVPRTGQTTFTALNAICTHQTCTVSGYQNGTYVCPCHLSEFSTSGAVIRGPAAAPLHSYATSFVSPTLTITIA
jgi:cytochrome b6-f complex iron-sulfur subunit